MKLGKECLPVWALLLYSTLFWRRQKRRKHLRTWNLLPLPTGRLHWDDAEEAAFLIAGLPLIDLLIFNRILQYKKKNIIQHCPREPRPYQRGRRGGNGLKMVLLDLSPHTRYTAVAYQGLRWGGLPHHTDAHGTWKILSPQRDITNIRMPQLRWDHCGRRACFV